MKLHGPALWGDQNPALNAKADSFSKSPKTRRIGLHESDLLF